jgi:hypothetical protein
MLLRVLQSIFQLEEAEIAGGVAPRLLAASYWRGLAYRMWNYILPRAVYNVQAPVWFMIRKLSLPALVGSFMSVSPTFSSRLSP